jgi:hypothetical protein
MITMGQDGMEQKGQRHHVLLVVTRRMLQGAPNSQSEELSEYLLA